MAHQGLTQAENAHAMHNGFSLPQWIIIAWRSNTVIVDNTSNMDLL